MPFISCWKLTWQYVPWEALCKGHFEVFLTSLETFWRFSLACAFVRKQAGEEWQQPYLISAGPTVLQPDRDTLSLDDFICFLFSVSRWVNSPYLFSFMWASWSDFADIISVICCCGWRLCQKQAVGNETETVRLPSSSARWPALIFILLWSGLSVPTEACWSAIAVFRDGGGEVGGEGGRPGSPICMSKTMPWPQTMSCLAKDGNSNAEEESGTEGATWNASTLLFTSLACTWVVHCAVIPAFIFW